MKKFLTGLIITILVILISAGVYYYVKTNSGTEESTPGFYVELPSGEKLTSNSTNLMLVKGAEHTFNISKDFDFAILPNTSDKSNDFTFTIDGANKQFFSELGLYYAFDIATTKNSISIGVPQDTTIKTLLQRIYTNKEIVVPAEFENSTKEMFTLQLKEKGGKSVYYINFGINSMLIDLPENLVF